MTTPDDWRPTCELRWCRRADMMYAGAIATMRVVLQQKWQHGTPATGYSVEWRDVPCVEE